MSRFFSRNKGEKKAGPHEDESEEKMPAFQLVVVDGNPLHNWVQMFEDKTLPDGSGIRVVQASWMEIAATCYSDSCLLKIAPIRESEGKIVRPDTIGVRPDFVLVRNQVRGPTPNQDRRRVLYGLMMANVPSINSLHAQYMELERPLMFGALKEIEKRVGHEKFPLISQSYYSGYRQMVISPEYPAVIKVGHAHAGMGKIKVDNGDGFRDVSTILALYDDYCTAEHFVEGDYGIRIQKVGKSYRVMKKLSTGAGWKSQFGGADLQEIELTDEYKCWIDEASKCFGGLDICALDAIHGNDGNYYIIELNGTAIGMMAHLWEEDSCVLRDLVIERMHEECVLKKN